MQPISTPSTFSPDSLKKPQVDESIAKSQAKGFPQSRRGKLAGGQPIGELMHQALAYPELISLAAGFVDDATLPVDLAIESFETMKQAGRIRKSLQYGGNTGDLELRKGILDFSFRAFPPQRPIDPNQVLLTAGSNQLLHLIADTLFDPGDIVLTAAPTYFVYLGTLKNMGVRTIGVKTDGEGLCPRSLEEVLGKLEASGLADRVKAVYLVPYFDNPASATIDANRRLEIAEVIERWRAKGRQTVLLADYAYQELGFEATTIPPWRSLLPSSDSYTIELGTFSKSFSPGIRIGWGIFPAAMMSMMSAAKANIDFGSPNFNQQWMLEVLRSGKLESHIATLRVGYRRKSDAMVTACRDFLSDIPGVRWFEPKGGLYVWVELPSQLGAGTHSPLYKATLEYGVLYVPGEYCFPEEGIAKRDSSMRLTFGVQSPERLREGVRLLSNAIRSLL